MNGVIVPKCNPCFRNSMENEHCDTKLILHMTKWALKYFIQYRAEYNHVCSYKVNYDKLEEDNLKLRQELEYLSTMNNGLGSKLNNKLNGISIGTSFIQLNSKSADNKKKYHEVYNKYKKYKDLYINLQKTKEHLDYEIDHLRKFKEKSIPFMQKYEHKCREIDILKQEISKNYIEIDKHDMILSEYELLLKKNEELKQEILNNGKNDDSLINKLKKRY